LRYDGAVTETTPETPADASESSPANATPGTLADAKEGFAASATPGTPADAGEGSAASATPAQAGADPPSNPVRRLLYGGAALVVLIAGLRAAQPILVLLLLAAFIAILCLPLLSWLTRRRVPPGLAVVLVILVAVAVLAGIAAVVGSSVSDLRARLPFYEERFQTLVVDLQAWLAAQGMPVSLQQAYDAVDPAALMGLVSGALSAFAAALSKLLLVLLVVIFILAEAAGMRRKLVAALRSRPDARDGATARRVERLDQVISNVQRYLALKTVISFGTAVGVGLWCWALGVDFPFLWGLVAFLLNYVPNIGSLLAAVPPVLLAMIQFGLGRALAVAAGFVAVNMLFGNLVEPLVMGRKLGLSSLVVLLSLIIWEFVLGPVGMLLSVPLTVMVRIGLEANPGTRWVAVLMGPAPEREQPRPPPPDPGEASAAAG
jgi:predicted PurR-regulated permease PerM